MILKGFVVFSLESCLSDCATLAQLGTTGIKGLREKWDQSDLLSENIGYCCIAGKADNRQRKYNCAH